MFKEIRCRLTGSRVRSATLGEIFVFFFLPSSDHEKNVFFVFFFTELGEEKCIYSLVKLLKKTCKKSEKKVTFRV